MRRYRFAIVGCGRIANRHAEQITRLGELVAVSDVNEEKAENLAKKFGVRAYNDLQMLLESEKDVEAVSICTPNGLHAAHVELSLQYGKHVLCEKPLTISHGEAYGLVENAISRNLRLAVVQSTRFNEAVLVLQRLVNEGQLGRLFSFQLNCFWNRPGAYYADNWKGTNRMDGGTLFTQFSHYIDVISWLFGNVKSISGVRRNFAHKEIEFEDCGVATLEMDNEMIGAINWSVNAYEKNMEVALTVIAENGTVQLGGQYMNMLTYQATNQETKSYDGIPGDLLPHTPPSGNHDKVYENFIQGLSTDDYSFMDVYGNIQTIKLIETIYAKTRLQNCY